LLDLLYEEIVTNSSDLMVKWSDFFYWACFAFVYFCCCDAYSVCGLDLDTSFKYWSREGA